MKTTNIGLWIIAALAASVLVVPVAHSQTERFSASLSGENEVPRLAITVGVGTILESRQCLLLATGETKAKAIRDTIEGPVTAQVTASALQQPQL